MADTKTAPKKDAYTADAMYRVRFSRVVEISGFPVARSEEPHVTGAVLNTFDAKDIVYAEECDDLHPDMQAPEKLDTAQEFYDERHVDTGDQTVPVMEPNAVDPGVVRIRRRPAREDGSADPAATPEAAPEAAPEAGT